MEECQVEWIFLKKNKVCFCVTNWKEQGSNTARVRGVIPTGATHSQKGSGEDERVLQNYSKSGHFLLLPLTNIAQ